MYLEAKKPGLACQQWDFLPTLKPQNATSQLPSLFYQLLQGLYQSHLPHLQPSFLTLFLFNMVRGKERFCRALQIGKIVLPNGGENLRSGPITHQ